MRGIKRLFRILVFLVIIAGIIGFVSHKYILKNMFPIDYEEYVYYHSLEYGLDPMMVFSVIRVESNFKYKAKSHKSATGLMQIMPETGKWIAEQVGIEDFKEEDLNDPETSIMLGCWYLNNLKQEFGDMDLVLAAYNAGRGNVNNWLKDYQYSDDGIELKEIPFKETREYIIKVNLSYRIYKYLYME